MFDKNTNKRHFQMTIRYIFSKYMHCDIGFSDVKIGALLCFVNVFGIAVSIFIY